VDSISSGAIAAPSRPPATLVGRDVDEVKPLEVLLGAPVQGVHEFRLDVAGDLAGTPMGWCRLPHRDHLRGVPVRKTSSAR